MTDLQHERLAGQAALYVVGALTPSERRDFDEHLAGCDACRKEVGSLAQVTGLLAVAVPAREPPAGLRHRVLSSIRETRGEVSRPTPASGFDWSRSAWLGLAAALAMALGVGAYAGQLRNRIQVLEERLDAALARAAAAELQIDGLRRTAAESQFTVAILAAPDLTRIEMQGEAPAPAARARAFWSRTRGLVVTATNLPPLPQGRVYQLWVVTPDAPISAALLVPDPAGQVTAVIQTPADLPTPLAMAVTLEPAGGVPAPTGDRYLIGTPSAAL